MSQSKGIAATSRAKSSNCKRTAVDIKHPSVQRRLKHIPKLFKPRYLKAISGGGLREAIICQCQECVNYVMVEVTLCTDHGCPLYPYRPYQKLGKKSAQ